MEAVMDAERKVHTQHKEIYGNYPMIIAAPGRVNLIGEHTDYNEGFVLPGAIDKRIYIGITPKADPGSDTITIRASQFNESIEFNVHDDLRPGKGWANFVLGVTHHIKETITDRSKLKGADILLDGDIPVGFGLSSSAALCSGYGFALNELFELGLSRKDLALIGQKTEHTFVGAKVGIMDQFASLHGKKGNLIKLDCRSLEYEYVPFNFPDYRIVLVNSMVSHSLASSEYNVRRQQCEEGVSILKKHYPEINSLRDVSIDQLQLHKNELTPVVYDRCWYVITEKERLLQGCDALRENDLATFGKLMVATHNGLSKQYAVSCTQLDFLAERAMQIDGVIGSRMMGGGFGGCTINIVRASAVDAFIDQIQRSFEGLFKQTPDIYVTQIEEGVNVSSE